MSKQVVGMEVYYPAQLFDVKTLDRVIENTLEESAQAVKVELRKITQTWKTRPGFSIDRAKYYRLVHAYTYQKIGKVFNMLDAGTKRHIIKAKNVPRLVFRQGGFKAKTTPRRLTSGPGAEANGPVRMPVQVNHPGTEAREWYDTTTEKWREELPVQMQRAIDTEVSRKGKQVRK